MVSSGSPGAKPFNNRKCTIDLSSLTEPWQGCKRQHTEDSPAASAL